MRSILLLAVVVAGCATPLPSPALCDMPPRVAGWNGTSVNWTGVVISAPSHGIMLACEHHLSGIAMDWDDETIGASRFEQALRAHAFEPGLLRIEVEGRLGRSYGPGPFGLSQDPPLLRLDAVSSVEWLPMTQEEVARRLDQTR
ncbi:hypothetical protein [Sphingosinicella terrae]|uniref:hypothetical protein n=1 Tax=Sphingosinicella terrae TaxID=2172047 RepID=UPI0013B44343|nr:hypothetical protein [Sphingosinicella terrae]